MLQRIIVQLTMNTANSVELLERIPLGDLLELYEAVIFEMESMNEKGAANAAP